MAWASRNREPETGARSTDICACLTRAGVALPQALMQEGAMSTGHFLAQDEEGNRYRILFRRDEHAPDDEKHAPRRFVLEDGSEVRRVDNETFRVLGTGAYVRVVPG